MTPLHIELIDKVDLLFLFVEGHYLLNCADDPLHLVLGPGQLNQVPADIGDAFDEVRQNLIAFGH